MSGIKEGQFYVYRDEDGNAVAIAMMAKGPNGGGMGVDYARMGVPYGKTTREDINNRAEFMVSAMNTFGNTKSVIDAKDAEIEAAQAEINRLRGLIEESVRCLDGEPEYHDQGMGCGLEDRGITDRYEAMSHGWEQAMERVYGENIAWAKDALASALNPKAGA